MAGVSVVGLFTLGRQAGQLPPLLLAHQMLPAQLPGPGLTTPEPNKSPGSLYLHRGGECLNAPVAAARGSFQAGPIADDDAAAPLVNHCGGL